MKSSQQLHALTPWIALFMTFMGGLPFSVAQSGQIVVMSVVCPAPGGGGASMANSALYAEDGRNYDRRLLPGDRFSPNEKNGIRVPDGCRLKLLFEGRTIEPAAGRDHPLKDLLPQDGKASRLSFTSRFLAFVGKCLDETTDEKKMLTNYRQNMSLRAGINGFSAQDYEIAVPLLAEGRVSTDFLTFYWSDGDHSDPFLFRLYRQRDKIDLLQTLVQDPRMQLTRDAVHLEPGEAYTWEVRSASQPARRSEPMTFLFDPEGGNRIMDDLLALPAYTEGTEEEKTIMYAFALEENEFHYDAAAVWEAALNTYPDNRFIRDLAAAFYARRNMLSQALGALR